jgi:hypothetical protein
MNGPDIPEISLLGELSLCRNGAVQVLPPSRKIRGGIAGKSCASYSGSYRMIPAVRCAGHSASSGIWSTASR